MKNRCLLLRWRSRVYNITAGACGLSTFSEVSFLTLSIFKILYRIPSFWGLILKHFTHTPFLYCNGKQVNQLTWNASRSAGPLASILRLLAERSMSIVLRMNGGQIYSALSVASKRLSTLLILPVTVIDLSSDPIARRGAIVHLTRLETRHWALWSRQMQREYHVEETQNIPAKFLDLSN